MITLAHSQKQQVAEVGLSILVSSPVLIFLYIADSLPVLSKTVATNYICDQLSLLKLNNIKKLFSHISSISGAQ